MDIINDTSYPLYVSGSNRVVIPKYTEHGFPEYSFQTTSIHSDIGSVEITTEYSERVKIRVFGNILCNEVDDPEAFDDNGLPYIRISEKTEENKG